MADDSEGRVRMVRNPALVSGDPQVKSRHKYRLSRLSSGFAHFLQASAR